VNYYTLTFGFLYGHRYQILFFFSKHILIEEITSRNCSLIPNITSRGKEHPTLLNSTGIGINPYSALVTQLVRGRVSDKL
jgi:hypothetical protein